MPLTRNRPPPQRAHVPTHQRKKGRRARAVLCFGEERIVAPGGLELTTDEALAIPPGGYCKRYDKNATIPLRQDEGS